MARSHPLSQPRTIRVIGRRAFRDSDPTDPNVAVVFDDDGNMLAEECRDVAADDAAAILAVIEQRRSDADFLVDGLTPSAFALYLSLRDALDQHRPAIETRLAGVPDHLLIALRVPDSDWYRKSASAFEAVVAGIVSDRVKTASKTVSVIPDHDRLLGHSVLPIETTLRHAKSNHVVALYSDEAELPGELIPFCDIALDLMRIVPRHFDTAIQREFDEPDNANWPAKIRMSDVDPDLLDAVCGRARAASDVVRMLGAVLAARDGEGGGGEGGRGSRDRKECEVSGEGGLHAGDLAPYDADTCRSSRLRGRGRMGSSASGGRPRLPGRRVALGGRRWRLPTAWAARDR